MPPEFAYAEIILPLALRQTYTYHIPREMLPGISPGKRVTVQFGKRKVYTGIVYKLHNNIPIVSGIKNIHSVLDDQPVVTEKQLAFWEWLADYYMCSLGEVFKAALPQGLKLESESRVFYNRNFDPAGSPLSEKEKQIIHYLHESNSKAISGIEKGSGIKGVHSSLPKLLEVQAIFIEERLKENYTPVREVSFSLSDEALKMSGEDLHQKLKRSPRQMEVMELFFTMKDESILELKQKSLQEKFNLSVIHSLEKSGWLVKKERSILRSPEFDGHIRKPFQLNNHQTAALAKIEEELRHKDVVLLHGVTSSGKTELYIELIDKFISEGRQVLYLLPEIALTSQIVERLQEVFGNKVGVFHSKFSDSERVDVYRRLLQGGEKEYKLVLGVRSAVFLPLRDPGLIIVDEEHENTFKQHDPAPRYHARDAAIILAGISGAKVILGTATPSFESFMNAKQGKYGYIELTQRYGGMMMPDIRVADLRKARLKKEMRSVFTPLLVKQIKDSLERGKQVILFQNRRGYSSYFQCEDCGEIPKCRLCDVSLTYHKYEQRLVCHYCGYSEKIPGDCSSCRSTRLSTRGFGTELVEDEIELIFPEARIARLDLDTTRSKKSYERILGAFGSGETNILVGTQMLSKGLDFDNVALVGILNADQMLNFPDFRAFERSFQLMLQVSGRAGRKKERGMVIIQTSEPEHPVIRYVINHDFANFYKDLSEERQVFGYPPFVKMIRIVLKSKEYKDGEGAATLLGEKLRKTFGKRVLGPQVPLVSRVKNQYLQHILLKIERNSSFKKARDILRVILTDIANHEEFRGVRVNVDVDPY